MYAVFYYPLTLCYDLRNELIIVCRKCGLFIGTGDFHVWKRMVVFEPLDETVRAMVWTQQTH